MPASISWLMRNVYHTKLIRWFLFTNDIHKNNLLLGNYVLLFLRSESKGGLCTAMQSEGMYHFGTFGIESERVGSLHVQQLLH